MSTSVKSLKDIITENVELNQYLYLTTSHEIHARPEIGNEEFFASARLINILEDEGFEVEKAVAGHETSFVARKRSEKPGPSIAFLAEYDALPGIGHACGHNIIGTTSVAAAIALSKVLDETGGEAVVFGTPAEEGGPNGSAKGSFVKHGLVEGIDAALMLHPSGQTRLTSTSLAVDPLDFEFIGKPAHAAASPHEGINALDAVIQLFNGINALRQQLTDDVRIHGIITHGGDAPNIIPEYAKARFFLRAATRSRLNDVTQRVKAVAEGAALATGAKLNVIAFQNKVDNLLLNDRYNEVFKNVIQDLGENVAANEREGIGSTDAGNISQVVPTIHPYIKIGPDNLVAHTVPFREAAASPEGDEALLKGAKALALTALQLFTNQELLTDIKAEFELRKAAENKQ
ncbi:MULTISPECIES: M20 family metallopeptidase [unclassified Mesobacillus]|jgi:amidohydrolase|uniref:M20 family metallopeptidase n=1 Tax=unclassified Mesobacillus TaxID=2675270 RepID=UPI00203CDA84|nr:MULTISPECIES: M20 family metallopeptidase [unclassified Mesobacillus]MCM3125036.1 M20 family metallopeptidase [Mesobacillus sp. MER 33]MCM3235204.1 M20 family metallopeptidase [Mesobacillus sp. MER 48]